MLTQGGSSAAATKSVSSFFCRSEIAALSEKVSSFCVVHPPLLPRLLPLALGGFRGHPEGGGKGLPTRASIAFIVALGTSEFWCSKSKASGRRMKLVACACECVCGKCPFNDPRRRSKRGSSCSYERVLVPTGIPSHQSSDTVDSVTQG